MEERGCSKWFLFTDQCSIHKGQKVRNRLQREGVPLVFNVPYSPEYAGIETFWANAKRKYKRMGTETLLRGEKRDIKT